MNISAFLQITDDGAVYRDGRLRVGQRILEVNGQSLLGGSHQEAVRALRSVGDKLVIMICDGFDPDLEEEPSPDTPSSPLGYLPRMRMSSGSSIDKVDEEHLIIMKVSWTFEKKVFEIYPKLCIRGVCR